MSVELVGNMIDQLHFAKAAEIDGLATEHIKHCHPILFVFLTDLLNPMQLYNYVPREFGIGLTVSISKGDVSKRAGSSNDYRGITVSAVISKIYEKI